MKTNAGVATVIRAKPCARCGQADRVFYASHGSWCMECRKEAARESHQKAMREDPERRRTRNAKASWRSRLKKEYGMTAEAYDALLIGQGGECAICGVEPIEGERRFPVDHDHDTGAVRGILCDACNVGLGRFADDPERLRAAAAYVERG